MRKLLAAALHRTLTFPPVWLFVPLFLVCGVIWGVYISDYGSGFGELIFVLLLAVCIALSVGREWGEGTLRNKAAAGHARWQIFLSEAVLDALFAAVAVLCAFAGILLGVLHRIRTGSELLVFPGAAVLLRTAVLLLLASIALSTLLTALCLCISRATAGVLAALLVAVALLFGGVGADELLRQTPLRERLELDGEGGLVLDDAGKPIVTVIPNEDYIGGFPRALLLGVQRLNPTEHWTVLMADLYYAMVDARDAEPTPENDPLVLAEREAQMRAQTTALRKTVPLDALIFTLAAGGVGVLFFRRKEMK